MELVDPSALAHEHGRAHRLGQLGAETGDQGGDGFGDLGSGHGPPRCPGDDRQEPFSGDAPAVPLLEDQDQPPQTHHRGRGDHQHQVGPPRRGAGQHVALFHVERADLVIALEVGIEIGHHQPVAAEQTVEAGLHGARTQHRPVAVAAQAEQQVVAAIARVEDVGAHGIDRRQIQPVGLDQLLEPRHDVTGVVEDALVGVQGQVGEHDQPLMSRR